MHVWLDGHVRCCEVYSTHFSFLCLVARQTVYPVNVTVLWREQEPTPHIDSMVYVHVHVLVQCTGKHRVGGVTRVDKVTWWTHDYMLLYMLQPIHVRTQITELVKYCY